MKKMFHPVTSQQRIPTGTLRFGSLKFTYARSGKGRDVAEKKSSFVSAISILTGIRFPSGVLPFTVINIKPVCSMISDNKFSFVTEMFT